MTQGVSRATALLSWRHVGGLSVCDCLARRAAFIACVMLVMFLTSPSKGKAASPSPPSVKACSAVEHGVASVRGGVIMPESMARLSDHASACFVDASSDVLQWPELLQPPWAYPAMPSNSLHAASANATGGVVQYRSTAKWLLEVQRFHERHWKSWAASRRRWWQAFHELPGHLRCERLFASAWWPGEHGYDCGGSDAAIALSVDVHR